MKFQFHEGPIKTFYLMCTKRPHTSFNSMKVRLKPYQLPCTLKYFKFQFHEGPIKTHCIFQ